MSAALRVSAVAWEIDLSGPVRVFEPWPVAVARRGLAPPPPSVRPAARSARVFGAARAAGGGVAECWLFGAHFSLIRIQAGGRCSWFGCADRRSNARSGCLLCGRLVNAQVGVAGFISQI